MLKGSGEMLDYIENNESSVRSYVRSFPTVFATGNGCWLTDVDGRQYIDFFSGAGALSYGHNPAVVKTALLEYIKNDGVQHSLDMATVAKVRFMRAFQDTILQPRGLEYKIQFTGPTGTNAVEAAIKLARKAKQRSHVVAFTNAYHGHTLGSLRLTGNRYYHNEFSGGREDVSHLPFDGYLGHLNTVEVLEKMLADPGSGLPLPAAVILETVQAEGGIRVASVEWLRRLDQVCRRYDILLIVDDIQVGVGRTGRFFSFEEAGIEPSIVCLSKAIGGGLPMAMVLHKPELDLWKPGEHTGTFRGNNLAFVAAAAVLKYWQDADFAEQIQQHGYSIEARLQTIAAMLGEGVAVRGRGMIQGLDMGNGDVARQISQKAFELGLIVETAGPRDEVLKLLPPLTISASDLQEGLDRFEQAIFAITGWNAERKVIVAPTVLPATTNESHAN